jgi:hypothetical protein
MCDFEQACVSRQDDTVQDLMLNVESHASLDIFKAMAKMGLLTTNSQEGQIIQVFKKPIDNSLFSRVSYDLPMTEEENDMNQWAPKERVDIWIEEYKRRGGICEDGIKYEKAYLLGLMLHDRAQKVTSAFNMLSNKIAMVVDTVTEVDDANAYFIPVTFIRFKSGALSRQTQTYAWQGNYCHEFDLECQGIDPSEEDRLSNVVFIDPSPGRKACSKKGLYADVVRALMHCA